VSVQRRGGSRTLELHHKRREKRQNPSRRGEAENATVVYLMKKQILRWEGKRNSTRGYTLKDAIGGGGGVRKGSVS